MALVAVDTNVVVRLLVLDDPEQAAQAKDLFRRSEILLPSTVLLECEWVLRFSYQFEPVEIATAFERLISLPNVSVEDRGAVLLALEWFRNGLDFADALHLSSANGSSEHFATFDRALVRKAPESPDLPRVAEPQAILPRVV